MTALKEEEKKILSEELELLSANPEIGSKLSKELLCLQSDIKNGSLDENSSSIFCYVLEMLLASGEIRKKYGYNEELLILRLYKNTKWGSERENNMKQVNNALIALQDHKIDQIFFSLKLPGVYGLVINTDKCQLQFEINQFGIQPDKIEMEL